MNLSRVEAFSDGVIAILITIMVLELPRPEGVGLAHLGPVVPVLFCYALSFVHIGIYWNNHHRLLKLTERTSGSIQWANLNLLFWLSLGPFTTDWMGEHHVARVPTAAYSLVLLACAVAYWVLQRAIMADQGPSSSLGGAVGNDVKGKASPILYAAAILVAFVSPWISIGLIVAVALLWLIPDRRLSARAEATSR